MNDDLMRFNSETGEELKESFYYKDGKLFWKKTCGRKGKPGKEAGWLNKTIGYKQVQLNNKTFYVHRVIFFLCRGIMPVLLDHINRDRTDNRIENLREASHYINSCNASLNSRNTSGHKGVSFNRGRNKWEAYVIKDRKKKNLGYYEDMNNAILAANKARKEYHGQYA